MIKLTTIPAHNAQLTGYYHMEANKDLVTLRNFEEKRLDKQEEQIKHCVFDNPEVVKNIKGVVQIGAAYGEQVEIFNKLLIPYQVYFEPVPQAFETTKQKIALKSKVFAPNVLYYNVAIGEKTGIKKFYECGPHNSNSSSLLPFSKVATDYNPKLVTNKEYEVPVWTLDNFLVDQFVLKITSQCNLLFMDVQGYEWYVIKGAQKVLSQFDYIYTEVNHIPLYEGTILFKEFNELMNENGFILADLTPLIKSTGSQSNALYKRVLEKDLSEIYRNYRDKMKV
jgi:FkbM family methyltransferase